MLTLLKLFCRTERSVSIRSIHTSFTASILSGNNGASSTVSAQPVDSRVGTVATHRYHLVVCNSSSAEWPSKVETMSAPITALARGSIRLPGRAMVTLSDFSPLKTTVCGCANSAEKASSSEQNQNKYDRIDVAVFPLGIVAKQLDVEGANSLLQWLSHEVLPSSWSTSVDTELPLPPFEHAWLELTRNRHIFVCTHGSRDYLCGTHGGKLLDELRALIEERGLSKNVAAWSTSHIGGHKYAANAIVYPRGDWYGTWCDKCRGSSEQCGPSLNPKADANAIIDSAVSDMVWWQAWRGAINMSKVDQIEAWTRNNSSGHEARVTGDNAENDFKWTPGTLRKRASQ